MNGFAGNVATFKEAIEVIKKFWKEFLTVTVVLILVNLLSQLIQLLIPNSTQTGAMVSRGIVGFILSIVFVVVSWVVTVGFFKVLIDGVGDVKPNIRDLYLQYRRVPSYLLSSFLASFISIIGLFLLVFTVFPLTARYQFVYLFVIDKKVGTAEALYLNDLATRGSLWKIIKFDIFLILINLVWVLLAAIFYAVGAGMLSFLPLLGLLFTAPVSVVAYVVAYKKFSSAPAQNVKEQNGKMIAIILALFVAFVIVIAVVGGGIFAALSSSPAFKNTIMQNTDFSSIGDAYKNAYKTSFVQSCVQGGADEETCSCMADFMVDNYTQEDLLRISSDYSESNEISQELTAASESCLQQ